MTFEEARKGEKCFVIGCDPGPFNSAFALLRFMGDRVDIKSSAYLPNSVVATPVEQWPFMRGMLCPNGEGWPLFLAYERVGFQGKCPGDATFETAAAGGEIRRAFRPFVEGTYAMRSSEWRHPLTGIGNAKTALVYQEICRFFEPTGAGSDPYKGTSKGPGPLWAFHQAGAGGNMDHLKDAAGVALGLSRVRFRSGADPEKFRLAF
jgi:hypothetical protein